MKVFKKVQLWSWQAPGALGTVFSHWINTADNLFMLHCSEKLSTTKGHNHPLVSFSWKKKIHISHQFAENDLIVSIFTLARQTDFSKGVYGFIFFLPLLTELCNPFFASYLKFFCDPRSLSWPEKLTLTLFWIMYPQSISSSQSDWHWWNDTFSFMQT